MTHDGRGYTERPIPTLSLFSGAGGLDLGFEAAGFDVRGCIEIEEIYCDTLRANIESGRHFSKTTRVYNVDIEHFNEFEFADEGIECIIGGPPCQTFSAAGRRSGGVIGTEDARGKLYRRYCQILDNIKPKVFVFENVYGLPGANGGRPWQEIVAEFRRHKYEIVYEVIDTADYGVPQHRERLIMVGVRDGTFVFPLPTHGPDVGTGQPLVSALGAIKDLQDPKEPFHDNLGGLYGHLLPKVPEGLNYAFFTSEMGHPEPVFAWRSKFHDLLYKVNRNEPCRTIKAQPGKFTGPFHWKNRHFTLAELKRLQTYPDDYELKGSYATQLEQIGNSVPPRMAEVFARSLREQIFDRVNKLTYPVRPGYFKSTFRRRQRSRSVQFRSIAQAAITKQYDNKPRYGTNGKHQAVKAGYTIEYSTLFARNVVKGAVRQGLPGANVTIRDEDGVVELDFRPLTSGRDIGNAKITITGLRKYLPEYDALTATCTLGRLNDVFHAWKEIEVALTARSRFFTLIDIYGHYANRGDVVDIESTFSFSAGSTPVTRAIKHFSQTRNCGDFLNKADLIRVLRLKADELPAMIESLRGLRYDFRSSTTHPILGEDRILCTYPFPLLSPRALVESRATFLPRAENSETSAQVAE